MWARALSLFARRIGAYLGRIASKNPSFMGMLTQRLRASGAAVGEGVSSIVKWVSNNKVNTILLASTIASMGYSIKELFDGEDDPEVLKFVEATEALETSGSGANAGGVIALPGVSHEVDAIINKVVSASELSAFGIDDNRRVADELLVQVLGWARRHYGSPSEAIRAHRMNQVFMELPAATVEHGFRTLKLA